MYRAGRLVERKTRRQDVNSVSLSQFKVQHHIEGIARALERNTPGFELRPPHLLALGKSLPFWDSDESGSYKAISPGSRTDDITITGEMPRRRLWSLPTPLFTKSCLPIVVTEGSPPHSYLKLFSNCIPCQQHHSSPLPSMYIQERIHSMFLWKHHRVPL